MATTELRVWAALEAVRPTRNGYAMSDAGPWFSVERERLVVFARGARVGVGVVAGRRRFAGVGSRFFVDVFAGRGTGCPVDFRRCRFRGCRRGRRPVRLADRKSVG